MKRYKRSSRTCALMTILVMTVFLIASGAAAQTEPLKVSVRFYKATYNLDEPTEQISADIIFENPNSEPVWVPEGFDQWDYELFLFFKGPGPDGPLITATSSGGDGSPTPSVSLPMVRVEKKLSGWQIRMPILELRDYYLLTQPGQYMVWFSMPFVQYDPQKVSDVLDENGDPTGFYEAPFNAVIWKKPLESPQEYYVTLTREVVPEAASIRVKCTEYVFGEGSHPGVTKQPITYDPAYPFEVRLYKRSAIEQAGITPINHQTCSRIVTDITIPVYRSTTTPAVAGEYIFWNVPRDDYIIIGCANGVTDYKHLWSPVGAEDLNWGVGEIFKTLILMTNHTGKKSPGKTMRVTGSELIIVEPEYVEWTSEQELYPFAFESVGDWNVEVSVAPPEGFVADQESVSEEILSALKAIQFTITDVGSKWKPTKVKYKLKHKGKTSNLESSIDIKLSRKLAKEKDVPEWGDKEEKKK